MKIAHWTPVKGLPLEDAAWLWLETRGQGPGQTPPGLSLAAHGFPFHFPFLKGFYTVFVTKWARFSNKN